MIYEDMSLEEVINYINTELLKGRTMRAIEENDFGVNERVIAKRLSRKGTKKVDGQFVLQSGAKMPVKAEKQVIDTYETKVINNKIISLIENNDFVALSERVNLLERILKEVACVQSGAKVVTNNLGLKIYSADEKPVPKTIRLHQDIWDKIDRVKEQFPHINYQTLLNSLIDEITEKYLCDK